MTIGLFLGTLLGTMAIGVPIAFALLLCAVALMWHLDLFDAQIIAQNILNGADSFALMAVPFFLLAGEIMNAGGLSKRIVRIALALVGHIRGGLGYVTIMAGCVLAALSGSAVADAAALAALMVPMMTRAGHDKPTSAGLVAAASCIAPVIPPSIGLIVFGVAGGVSITKLFLAGIVPGLMLGLALAAAWWFVVRNSEDQMQTQARVGARERLRALAEGFWALMLPVIIIVGLRMGVFTPTEAAVVAAVYSLFVAVCIYRELAIKDLYAIFLDTARATSIVMFLIAAALVVAWLVNIADLPGMVVDLVEPFMDHPTLLMLAIMLLIVAICTCMDMIPAILILTPVLIPVIKEAGIDPVYFGVLFILNCSISLITPPVGSVLNVVAGSSKTSIEALVKGVWPFLLAMLCVLFLLVLFPSLVMVPANWFSR
ncbi:TRAP transporter large permease subunit [Verticiella sediminum]|uniref:TRAP transporter large permease protein n=1 Tax=Verticiella sediminum TaxID=1247510 RepID=A0A556AXJ8_9BURK|nr:TRAP transporter large permease subunit [Verticiella sediminum]TSH97616.1 TRAP transporter large permease subunit [Verticiella sediminum]